MTRIRGKVVWITGASSGIGEELVYAFAKRKDVRLILSARRTTELERVKGNCPKEIQPNVRILPFDMSQAEALHLTADAAIQLFGQIDILINNAGVSQRSFVKDTDPAVTRRLMEVNFFGPTALTRYLLPHFLKRRSGHIVVISSVTGKFGTPYRSGYAASKHALHGYFDSLRAEVWRENIIVTMVCPGFISTPITLSALTGDGTPLNERDEANYKGKKASWVAKKILNAIRRDKKEVYYGGKEVLGVYVMRWSPRLFARLIRTAKVR